MIADCRIEEGLAGHIAVLGDRLNGGAIQHLGISFLELSRQVVRAALTVTPHHHQPFGILHGGISVVLAETVASVAAWLHADPQTEIAVGVEINANHLRPVQSGVIEAIATPIQTGKTLHVWQIAIIDQQTQKQTCSSRCTLMIAPRK
jgi:1,4-dihydroxy-2-naphthoyl-CoA hydrolase